MVPLVLTSVVLQFSVVVPPALTPAAPLLLSLSVMVSPVLIWELGLLLVLASALGLPPALALPSALGLPLALSLRLPPALALRWFALMIPFQSCLPRTFKHHRLQHPSNLLPPPHTFRHLPLCHTDRLRFLPQPHRQQSEALLRRP